MLGYSIGGLAFAVFIGQATSWLENMDHTQADFSRLLREVHEFLRFTKIPQGLCERIIDYYHNCYHGKLIEMSLLSTMNLKLRTDFYSFCVMDILTQVPILGEVEHQFLEALVNLVKFEFYQLGDPIVRQDEITGKLFLLRKGTVKANRKGLIIQTTLRDGEYFGEDCLISEGYLSESTVWADSDVSCFTLTYRDFQNCLKDFPLSHSAVKNAVKEMCNDRGMELRDTIFAMNEANKQEKMEFDLHRIDMQSKILEQGRNISKMMSNITSYGTEEDLDDDEFNDGFDIERQEIERRNKEIEDDLKEIQKNYSVSSKTVQAIKRMSIFDNGGHGGARVPLVSLDALKRFQKKHEEESDDDESVVDGDENESSCFSEED